MTTATHGQRHPAQHEIAQRAYQIHLARGGAAGHELEDWLLAEAELLRGLDRQAPTPPVRSRPPRQPTAAAAKPRRTAVGRPRAGIMR